MAILKTENLTYIYGAGTPFEKTAVDNVSLEIERGTITGIIGHTGSGKSTLIQHFNGLLRPSFGKIFFDGKDIWENKKIMPGIRFKIGLVFQYPEYQMFEETVYKDIAFAPKNMMLSEEKVKKRVLETAKLLNISSDMLKSSPFELSGGQKRRVAIAGVMAMQPEVLVLDEPAAGLDPAGKKEIFELIKEYNQKTGCTIIVVSHSMEDMAKYAQKIIVMNKSKIFCHEDTRKVFSYSKEIAEMGLDVPQITKVFMGLEKYGVCFDEKIYTVKYAKEKILRYLEKKGGADICSKI